MKIKDALKNEVTPEEYEELPRSFDTVGDIAILEIRDNVKHLEKKIAKKLLEMHKQIKVVLKKKGGHEGVFRLQKMSWLAGTRRKETLYKESGARMKLNVEQT